MLEAFEARAARMSVACAKNLSQFANPEEGKCFDLVQLTVYLTLPRE